MFGDYKEQYRFWTDNLINLCTQVTNIITGSISNLFRIQTLSEQLRLDLLSLALAFAVIGIIVIILGSIYDKRNILKTPQAMIRVFLSNNLYLAICTATLSVLTLLFSAFSIFAGGNQITTTLSTAFNSLKFSQAQEVSASSLLSFTEADNTISNLYEGIEAYSFLTLLFVFTAAYIKVGLELVIRTLMIQISFIGSVFVPYLKQYVVDIESKFWKIWIGSVVYGIFIMIALWIGNGIIYSQLSLINGTQAPKEYLPSLLIATFTIISIPIGINKVMKIFTA
jgi:hypothetical protein